MNKFFDWLLKSSADPNEVALTAKGLVSSLLPIFLVFAHNPNLSSLPDQVYSIVVAALTLYSSVAIVIGLARKIFLTFTA